MANSKSAEKRIRQNNKRRDANRVIRGSVRTTCKRFEQILESGDLEAATVALVKAHSALDRAASKGIIPSARADRKKGRLAARLAKASA